MQHTVCYPHERLYDTFVASTDTTSPVGSPYATTPMPAYRPIFQQVDEEELYTSFEEAISDRVLAVNRQLSRLNGSHSRVRQTSSRVEYQKGSGHSVMGLALLDNAWQSSILLISVALMFILAGFDLMGLLVLHVH